MVILGKWKNQPLTISLKPNSATFSIERKPDTAVYSFDREARLWTAMIEGISYRRGLNGKIVAKWKSDTEVLHRKWLEKSECESLLASAHQIIETIVKDLKEGVISLTQTIAPSELVYLSTIANFTIMDYQKDEENYSKIYKPVGILPPDQYISVVLQLTEGCSFNTCTFCNFYHDRPFRIKSTGEFFDHLSGVKNFIGKGLSLRRTIFLGDANALVVPQKRLIPLMEMVHQHFDVEKLGGMFAFLDGFSGDKKTLADYRVLKDLGLQKIYFGLESGHDPLLQFLRKPGTSKDALQAVNTIKQAGISVGIIVLLGAGGHNYAAEHIKDTVSLINKMMLDEEDLIYFSELIESEGLAYTASAFQNKLIPLTPQERIAQGKTIEDQLVFREERTPHISRYDIRDFVY